MAKFIGCDFGASGLRAAIVDIDNGATFGLERTPTRGYDGQEAVIRRIIDLIELTIARSGVPKEDVGGIGIGTPGLVDMDQGIVLNLPNLPGGWHNVPLAHLVSDFFGIRTWLINDSRSMTLGEFRYGLDHKISNMACLTLGTGVGGGLILDGRLYLGIDGAAGEFGHLIVDMDGFPCGCGSRGCLEAHISSAAIVGMAVKAVRQGRTTIIGEIVAHDLNRITSEVVFKAACRDDDVALEIWQYVGKCLAIAISDILITLGPEQVVIAGGVAQAGGVLLNPTMDELKKRVRVMSINKVSITLSTLKGLGGVVGAAQWAAQQTASK